MDIDKVDMSLDDIIKLNKKGTRGRGNGQRGGRVSTNSRGAVRGGSRIFTRGGGATKMRGRGQNRYADATQSPRGRRGRGRGNIGVSPLNRQKGQSPVKNVRGGGRGGRGGMRGGRGRGRGQGANGQTQQGVEQNSKVGFTSLNRRKMQAIESLLKAKQTLAELNAKQRAQQKQSRAQVVNTRRGLQTSPEPLNQTSARVGRGRGRRGGLSRFGSTMSLNSVGSQKQRGRGRGLNNSFSGSTMSINSIGSQKPRGRGRGRGVNKRLSGSTVSLNSVAVGAQQNQNRRQWRTPKAQTSDQPILTVSVKNSPKPQRRNRIKRYQTQGTDPDLQAQIANLKPAVSQKYNFKMAVFAQASTSSSLNDRFTATSPNQSSFSKVGRTGAAGTGAAGTGVDLMGRKVFF